MDVGLRSQQQSFPFYLSLHVSILVLMDVGLRSSSLSVPFTIELVSILVLMDVGLRLVCPTPVLSVITRFQSLF